ncbi:MAG TPA: peptidase M14, partial [Caldimonas sp.]|nr:peptidase M14 [Caldimonas sp.]
MAGFDRSRATRRGATVLAVALLGACASSPPPRAPAIFAPPAPRPPVPQASAPVRANTDGGAPPAAAIATPVRPPAPITITPLPTPTVPPAVAARFPEPAVTFPTPAFEAGRTTFTSNDELGAILRGLARGAAIGENSSEVSVIPLGAS